ncbi:MAG: insulinase family protein [Clostridia bacterium]|nr:insulinase family protein [Clostridia bacterium]
MYQKVQLPNGLRLVVEEVPYFHSVAIGIWVRAGSRNETPAIRGVSHFLEHLLFKGTTRRTAKQIAQELEAVGGVLNAFTTKEYTCFYAKVLAEHLPLAVDVLADMFFNSLMDEKDIEKEKRVVLEEIRMYDDSPDELVHDLFARAVWQDHPLGWSILGSYESVASLDREKIIGYYRDHYTPGNTVVAIAGKVRADKVIAYLSPIFGGRPNQGAAMSYHPPVPHAAVELTPRETEQVQLCLGTPGLAQDDSLIYALQILNNVAGGGLSSRLFQEIREERGLAYSVYSYHSTYHDSGLFTVYAGTGPDSVKEVVRLILRELAKIKKEGITREELRRSQEQMRGSLLLGMENVSNRMSRLGKTELCYGRVITTEEMLEQLSRVTPEEVQYLAERLFLPEKFALTAIGPLKEEIDLATLLDGAAF